MVRTGGVGAVLEEPNHRSELCRSEVSARPKEKEVFLFRGLWNPGARARPPIPHPVLTCAAAEASPQTCVSVRRPVAAEPQHVQTEGPVHTRRESGSCLIFLYGWCAAMTVFWIYWAECNIIRMNFILFLTFFLLHRSEHSHRVVRTVFLLDGAAVGDLLSPTPSVTLGVLPGGGSHAVCSPALPSTSPRFCALQPLPVC